MITHKTRGFGTLRSRILAAPRDMRKELESPVRDEARLFVNAAIKITPPASAGVTGTAAKRQGEATLESDIRRVYLSPGLIFGIIKSKNPDAAKAFWAAVKGNPTSRTKSGKLRYSKKGVDLVAAQRIMGQFAAEFRNVRIAPFDAGALHKKLRNPRTGRVKKRDYGIVLSKTTGLEGYIRKEKGKVGKLGGGFNEAAQELGAKVPEWMRRHGIHGDSIQVITSRNDFAIIIRNAAPYAQSAGMQYRMTYVHKYRQNALRRKLTAILNKQSKRIATG